MNVSIETLAKDEFFKRKETSKKVYLTKGYCRINKAYEAVNWDDISDSIYLKKGKQVFTNFEF
jgi:hypothetical protein